MTDWAQAHSTLATLFSGTIHGAPYAGYKPDVAEAPNGDTKQCLECVNGTASAPHGAGGTDTWSCGKCHGTGRVPNVDAGRAGKRYLHVAAKYDPPALAMAYHDLAFAEACRVATALGVPAAFMPDVRYGALRVLEYPDAGHAWNIGDHPHTRCEHCGVRRMDHEDEGGMASEVCPALAAGAGTAEHRDFDLFTLNLWRSTPEDHEQFQDPPPKWDGIECLPWTRGVRPHHIGELGTIIGLGPAPLHRVPARPYTQRALVYFAIPDHKAWLPCKYVHSQHGPDCCPTVGQWLAERQARSRVYK